MIDLDKVTRQFNNPQGRLTALDSISFRVERAEFTCIVGPSGCGKSTLLRIIAGLLEPTSGEVRFDAEVVNSSQQKTAMVFQNQALFPWMTILDNVTLGLRAQGWPRAQRDAVARDMLARFGLSEFESSKPNQLSGGMQQRAALARAFLADPQVLLMDEPFRSLDAQTRLILQQELLDIWLKDQKTVIFVTHDIDEAIRLGDRIVVMRGRPGRIRTILPVNLPRPRSMQDLPSQDATQIKWEIWKMLEEEAREAVRIRAQQPG